MSVAAATLAACGGAPDVDPLALHRDAIVVDGHSDTTPWFQDPEWSFAERHDAGHMDLPRIREGGLDAQFWSIWMGKTEGHGRAVRDAVERMDAVHELVRQHPADLMLATTAADVRRAAAERRLACLMGVEGGHILEGSLAALRTYHRLGARYLTLTHSFHNRLGDSSGTSELPPPEHGGLTDFGRTVVAEMNRLGMMADISHVSDATFFDVLATSRAPVIASHSSARGVADHPRNMSDPMLRALGEAGGVVMINFYSGYIDAALVEPLRALYRGLRPQFEALGKAHEGDPLGRRRAFRALMANQQVPQTTLGVLLDHFDHAIRVAGPANVGLGSDWDGVGSMPLGLDDVSKLPALTAGLLERGHSPDVVRGVLGENVLRVMAEVEAVAAAQP